MASVLILVLAVFAGVTCHASPGRIVGGQDTTISQYPSLVQVEFLGLFSGTWSQSCAGNILNSVYVLSAANCFDGALYDPSYRRIRAGATYRETDGTVVLVQSTTNHPDFGSNGMEADISLVRLASALTWSSVIAQGSIIAQGFVVPDGQSATLAGWGATEQGGSFSSVLQHVLVLTVNNDECSERYQTLANPGTVTDNMICTGILDVGGSDACQGDAGGPVYYGGVIVGIISWGHRCANATFPGVNTYVGAYTNWIVANAV